MPYLERISDLSPQSLARFDAVIDVRSPAEFADDHLPGAVSLPVLSNEERARVGTIYKQESPFEANRIGAALVARNIASHLETALSDQPKSFRPLIYCWRGGMRSNAMATILSSVGWPVGVIEGGYRRWRRDVLQGLEVETALLPVHLIDGQTGTGKTALLGAIALAGGQVIDLEALAHHRGSAFGGFESEDQPPQRLFESVLWDQIRQFDGTQPIYVEAESARVGARRVPRRLWFSMRAAPRTEISAPLHARAQHLMAAYGDAVSDLARIDAALSHLAAMHSKETIADWRALAQAGDMAGFTVQLMREHYDPLYARARKRFEGDTVLQIELAALNAPEFARAAAQILNSGALIPAQKSGAAAQGLNL